MRLRLMALMLIFSKGLVAQINFVLNPGLEEYTKCPTHIDNIRDAKYWSSIDSNELPNSRCLPEYLNTCSGVSQNDLSLPKNWIFWQYPRSGNGMVQVQMFYDENFWPTVIYRDYLQGRLFKKLTAGKSYCVKFYVNYEEASKNAIKEIGVYLDNGSIDTSQYCDLPKTQYKPQVVNTGGIISDTAGWTKIEGSFIAKGNEQFITIGNFTDKTHTTYIATPIDSQKYIPAPFSMYLVDDVSVIESDLKADAGPDTHVGAGDSVYVGRPKEVGLENTWNVLGNPTVIGTGAGIWVKPSVTTSYVVTQTICGVTKKDTVRVEVWAAGVQSVNGQRQEYNLVPNPVHYHMQLLQGVPDEKPVVMSLYDATGRLVLNRILSFKENRAGIDVSDLSAGFYYLKLNDVYGNVYSLKVVKE